MSRIALLGVAGIGAAWLLALAFGDTPAAATEVVALSAGAAFVLSLLGLAVTRHLGQRPLSVYLWVVALTTVLGIVAGTVLAGSRMFLSAKDERTAIVVLVAAATVGGLAAIVLARTLSQGIGTVSRLASSLGQRPHDPQPRFRPWSSPTWRASCRRSGSSCTSRWCGNARSRPPGANWWRGSRTTCGRRWQGSRR